MLFQLRADCMHGRAREAGSNRSTRWQRSQRRGACAVALLWARFVRFGCSMGVVKNAHKQRGDMTQGCQPHFQGLHARRDRPHRTLEGLPHTDFFIHDEIRAWLPPNTIAPFKQTSPFPPVAS